MGFKIKNSLTGEFEKLPILTLKGEKGETGGVEEYNKVDYMGNKYETLKQANDANVEYAVKTAIGEFNYLDYDGQHITATDTIEGRSKSAILKGHTLNNLTTGFGNNEEVIFNRSWQELSFCNDIIHNNLKNNDLIYMSFEINVHEINIPNNVLKIETSRGKGGYAFIIMDSNGIDSLPKNNWIRISCIRKVQEDIGLDQYKFGITVFGNHPTNNGEQIAKISVRNAIWLNLTETFGSGTEPDKDTCDSIPYFEGMQSVKMPVLTTTGNNLFDGELEYGDIDNITGETTKHSARSRSKDFIKTIPSASYFMYSDFPSDSTSKGIYVYQYDSNKKYIGFLSNGANVLNEKFTVADNCHFIKIRTTAVSTLAFNIGVMSDGETYEPYKSNILTTPEDLTLRGIGDVKDTLDCLTGEVVQKFTTKTYNGSENWILHTASSNLVNCLHFFVNENDMKKNGKAISPQIKTLNYSEYKDDEYISIGGSQHLHYKVDKNKLTSQDVNGFKQWLSQNPFTVQYQLATESVKTVDLTTVDQDGQPTKLKTFNDITHVEIKADNLIPSVDVEVATKISETLSTMGLKHHDISEAQNKLGQTIDEQTENTDATMMATTEIYENL